MSEIWKQLIDYPGYEFSSHGNVRRLDGKAISIRINNSGYKVFGIEGPNGKIKARALHPFICRAFHGEPPSPLHTDANHKDGIKLNNHEDNLEWETAAGNKLHAAENGLVKSNTTIEMTDLVSGETKTFYSVPMVARYFNLTLAKGYEVIINHFERAYLDRYIFEVTKLASAQHEKKIPIGCVDFVNGRFVRASSVREMAWLLKRSQYPIHRALKNGSLLDGLYLWKLSDIDWMEKFPHFTQEDVDASIALHARKKAAAYKGHANRHTPSP